MKPTQHNAALDGLRGVAAFLVVLFHMEAFVGSAFSPTDKYTIGSPVWQMYRRVIDGNFPVAVFFVLSGFVLLLGFDRKRDLPYLAGATVKRYFRLTPVVLASTVLAWLASVTIGLHNASAAAAIGGNEGLTFIYRQPLTFIGSIWNGLAGAYRGDDSYNYPLWTLSIELTGSLMLFGIAALFYRSERFWIVALAVAAGWITLFGTRGVYYTLFLAGALMLRYPSLRLRWYWLIPAAYLGAENIWLPEMVFVQNAIPKSWNLDVTACAHAIGAVMMLASVLGSAKLKSVFGCRPLAWLGRVSFSLYVCHAIVIASVGCWVLEVFALRGELHLGGLLAIAATVVVSLVLAQLMTTLVDGPAQRLANWIANAVLQPSRSLPETSVRKLENFDNSVAAGGTSGR
ncbi:acyltransferase family protein [Caballeronia zhejiangensis]|uniref:acyltransferase family protein n=1 Tax=Caballeronia zhejiangensis TaxID=871203 RepID=UPI00158A2682|nr:acyltransferase [Caballeronia zhejiangensis]